MRAFLLSRIFLIHFAAAALVICASPARAQQISDLWGTRGEKWRADGPLPDFSFAGYQRGEKPIPRVKQVASVKDFGAKGDGRADDTEAIRKAIDGSADGAILLPAGRYVVSDVIEIRKSGVVLRGEGPEKTTIVFSRGLEEIKPSPTKNDGGDPTTAWSWGGGLITISGRGLSQGTAIPVLAQATRGATTLAAEGHAFSAGDEIILNMTDTAEGSLVDYLYRGKPGNASGIKGSNKKKVYQVFRVTAARPNAMDLDRPLRFDVRKEWTPTLTAFQPDVSEVGIEDLAFECPEERYAGHFKEKGFNPIEIRNAAHCWVKNVRMTNVDNGPFLRGVFGTVDGISFDAGRKRVGAGDMSGHHGVSLEGGDGLCTRFEFDTKFYHDVTVSGASMGNVISKGKAVDFNMDHHRWCPYENLFTDIDAGKGTRLFSSGGGGNRGNHTAAGATFWNIRTKEAQVWPSTYGVERMNLVALRISGKDVKDLSGRWLETISPGRIQPPDLHEAMLRRRLELKSP